MVARCVLLLLLLCTKGCVFIRSRLRKCSHERRERERERKSTTGVSLGLFAKRGSEGNARDALWEEREREREREKEREKEIAQCKCIISNDYLVVVLVADDRSQSRDVAQSRQDDKEAETITTIPRRRPHHRPHPRCFGAGLLHNNREGERHREMCVSRSNKTSFGSLSLLVGFKVLSP